MEPEVVRLGLTCFLRACAGHQCTHAAHKTLPTRSSSLGTRCVGAQAGGRGDGDLKRNNNDAWTFFSLCTPITHFSKQPLRFPHGTLL